MLVLFQSTDEKTLQLLPSRVRKSIQAALRAALPD
jgi:hypothetical protein